MFVWLYLTVTPSDLIHTEVHMRRCRQKSALLDTATITMRFIGESSEDEVKLPQKKDRKYETDPMGEDVLCYVMLCDLLHPDCGQRAKDVPARGCV